MKFLLNFFFPLTVGKEGFLFYTLDFFHLVFLQCYELHELLPQVTYNWVNKKYNLLALLEF